MSTGRFHPVDEVALRHFYGRVDDWDGEKRAQLLAFLGMSLAEAEDGAGGINRWSFDYAPNRGFMTRVFALRQMPYSEYLRSSHWRLVRERALRRGGFRCACGAPATVGHHENYRFLGCEPPEDVVAKCKPCHDRFHETWLHAARGELGRQLSPEEPGADRETDQRDEEEE